MDDNKELVEKMLVAFLTEKSAQCGEPFYMDMWEEYKREKPDEYHEEFVQMQCALSSIQPELDKRDEAYSSLLEARASLVINPDIKRAIKFIEEAMTILDTTKTTTGHEQGGGM